MTLMAPQDYRDHVAGCVTLLLDNDRGLYEGVLVAVRTGLHADGYTDDPDRYADPEWAEIAGVAVREYVLDAVASDVTGEALTLLRDLLDVNGGDVWRRIGDHYLDTVRDLDRHAASD